MKAILLTKQNIPIVAASLGISTSEMFEQMRQAKYEHKKKQDMQFILSFFNADEKWYKETADKVAKIAASLPEGIGHKEKTIKMYGWIEKDTKISGSLSIPMELDYEYSASTAIQMVFTGQIDLYHKIMRWD